MPNKKMFSVQLEDKLMSQIKFIEMQTGIPMTVLTRNSLNFYLAFIKKYGAQFLVDSARMDHDTIMKYYGKIKESPALKIENEVYSESARLDAPSGK
jgi:hypothetical protein